MRVRGWEGAEGGPFGIITQLPFRQEQSRAESRKKAGRACPTIVNFHPAGTTPAPADDWRFGAFLRFHLPRCMLLRRRGWRAGSWMEDKQHLLTRLVDGCSAMCIHP